MKEKSWKPWALLAPSLTAVFLLLVIPVCFVVVYSFWLRAPSGGDIPDPFGSGIEVYRACAAVIREALEARLSDWTGSGPTA